MPDSAGDPQGRRLARQKARYLEEAQRIGYLLEAMLRRAGAHEDACNQLLDDMQRSARRARRQANDRIARRTRYRLGSGHPLTAGRPESVLHLDESGSSGSQPNEPESWFAIGAVAIDPADISAYESRADDIKQEFFGTTDITFHEPLMRQRKERFYFGNVREREERFDEAMRSLIHETPATYFGAGIRKAKLTAETLDPYLPTSAYPLAITLLLERYIDFLAHSPNHPFGRLMFESIGPREDAERQAVVVDLLLHGTQWVSDGAFRGQLHPGAHYAPKRGSDVMELADIVAREVYEWTRSGCTVEPKFWDVVSPRFYARGDFSMGKFGLKIFPDRDIRDVVQAHRARFGPLNTESALAKRGRR